MRTARPFAPFFVSIPRAFNPFVFPWYALPTSAVASSNEIPLARATSCATVRIFWASAKFLVNCVAVAIPARISSSVNARACPAVMSCSTTARLASVAIFRACKIDTSFVWAAMSSMADWTNPLAAYAAAPNAAPMAAIPMAIPFPIVFATLPNPLRLRPMALIDLEAASFARNANVI